MANPKAEVEKTLKKLAKAIEKTVEQHLLKGEALPYNQLAGDAAAYHQLASLIGKPRKLQITSQAAGVRSSTTPAKLKEIGIEVTWKPISGHQKTDVEMINAPGAFPTFVEAKKPVETFATMMSGADRRAKERWAKENPDAAGAVLFATSSSGDVVAVATQSAPKTQQGQIPMTPEQKAQAYRKAAKKRIEKRKAKEQGLTLAQYRAKTAGTSQGEAYKARKRKKRMTSGALSKLSKKDLVAMHEEQFGSKPKSNITRETLETKLKRAICGEELSPITGAIAAAEDFVEDTAQAVVDTFTPAPPKRKRRKKKTTKQKRRPFGTVGYGPDGTWVNAYDHEAWLAAGGIQGEDWTGLSVTEIDEMTSARRAAAKERIRKKKARAKQEAADLYERTHTVEGVLIADVMAIPSSRPELKALTLEEMKALHINIKGRKSKAKTKKSLERTLASLLGFTKRRRRKPDCKLSAQVGFNVTKSQKRKLTEQSPPFKRAGHIRDKLGLKKPSNC